MPDLSDELRRLADDGAQNARPLPAADVLRLGDRRRRFTMVQLSAGGVVAAGLAVAGSLVASTVGSTGPAATSGSAISSAATTSSATSTAGTMTLQVSYQREARGRLNVLSVTFFGHATHVIKDPLVQVTFGPSSARRSKLAVGSFGIPVKLDGANDFHGSISGHDLRVLRKGQLAGTEPVSATLSSRDQPASGPAGHLIVARTVLTSARAATSPGTEAGGCDLSARWVATVS